MLFVVFLEICSLSHQVLAVVLLHNWGSGQQKRQSHSVSVGTKPHRGPAQSTLFTNAFSLDADLSSSLLVISVSKKFFKCMYRLNKTLVFMWLLF